jgi:hypothetical protein
MEFFFSNVLLKVYQLPMLFTCTSEFPPKDFDSSFIVLIYEYKVSKRKSLKKNVDINKHHY